MVYKFRCPECNKSYEITMKMSEYTEDGFTCNDCNVELKRDISDICISFDTSKISGFCGKCGS